MVSDVPENVSTSLLLHDGIESRELPLDTIHLYLDGKQSVKGVIDGVPFPIVYCDMKDGKRDNEERLLGIPREHQPDILREYLREFFDETPDLVRPFIEGDPHPKYSRIPDSIANLREQLKSEETDHSYLVDGEVGGPAATGEPHDLADPSIKDTDDAPD